MIKTEFNGFKFFRTYINGSKKNESRKFINVQGNLDDELSCDLFEYRRMLNHYFNDCLHILLSWKDLFKYLLMLFLLSLIYSINFKIFFIINIILLFIFFIGLIIIKSKYNNMYKAYFLSSDLLSNQIKKMTGLNLTI